MGVLSRIAFLAGSSGVSGCRFVWSNSVGAWRLGGSVARGGRVGRRIGDVVACVLCCLLGGSGGGLPSAQQQKNHKGVIRANVCL